MFKKNPESGESAGNRAGRTGSAAGGTANETGGTGMKRLISDKPLVKKRPVPEKKRDFTLNITGAGFVVAIVLFTLAGLRLNGGFYSLADMGFFTGVIILTIFCMVLFPRWAAAVKLYFVLACLVGAGIMGIFPDIGLYYGPALFFAALGVLAAPSVQKLNEWERAIVLRFGRFHRVRGPGLFALIPLVDRVAETVDLRIRVTDFAAQETLTRDSVTVTVDALCFWLVWDPEKAILEVEKYEDAVILSAKTALRNSISSHDLSTFLEHGEVIQKQIQEEVDRKTTEWGITIQHIEITDIQIPEALQDSLSRIAQAEREKKGRILLADAEIEIAKKLEEAILVYSKNEPALKLKILSILNEGLKAGNSMMLVPNSITEELKAKDVFGLEALMELRRKEKEE
jgi:regulator of protease activity HflC (stomatin/prohibitin superfamily)